MNKADLFYKPLLQEAWGLVKKYYWIIFLFGLISIVFSVVLNLAQGEDGNFFVALLSIFVSVIMNFFGKRLSMWVARQKDFKFGDIFEGFENFWKYFVTSIIYGLIIIGGFILLIVPGIIWAIKYSLAPYYSLEKGMGFKEALKASANATSGVKGKMFALSLLLMLIVLVSVIPVGLGLLATIPLAFVLQGLLYVRLSGSSEGAVVGEVVANVTETQTDSPQPINS